MTSNDRLDAAAELFSALADKTRLRILNLMREDEICVCFFAEALDESQPKISRHLAFLRRAEIVESRREGKWMHYRIAEPDDPGMAAILENTLEFLWSVEEMRADYDRLEDVCCAADQPVTIARAPKPETIIEREEDRSEEVSDLEEMETYLL